MKFGVGFGLERHPELINAQAQTPRDRSTLICNVCTDEPGDELRVTTRFIENSGYSDQLELLVNNPALGDDRRRC